MFLINSDHFLKALDITWKGMGYLFLAMFLMYLTVYFLNKFTNKNKK